MERCSRTGAAENEPRERITVTQAHKISNAKLYRSCKMGQISFLILFLKSVHFSFKLDTLNVKRVNSHR